MTTPAKKPNAAAAKSTARKSDSAPAKMPPGAEGDLPVEKAKATNALAASMPIAKHKMAENGHGYAVRVPTPKLRRPWSAQARWRSAMKATR